VSEALATPRYLRAIIALFATTALTLSVVGIYGVMTYFVQQHTRDIGIRLALGGDPAGLQRMVVLQGLRPVALGIAAGVGAAILASRLMSTILFGVNPTDLRMLCGVPAMLLTIAALACLVPARRAAAIDPAVALRES
jgi:putative ABC transport system permease protein